jgi:hypothetical protein
VKPGHSSDGLAFTWHDAHVFSLVLPGFVIVSLALHAVGFYILQVKYPPAVSVVPPPASIHLLAPSPENERLLRWIAAEDPSIGLAPEPMPLGSLLDAPYRSAWETRTPEPLLPDSAPATGPYPPGLTLQERIAWALPSKPSAREVGSTAPTSVLRFAGPIASRAANVRLPVPPTRISSAAGASRYFVGVADDGEVRFAFLQTSCGNEQLDLSGELLLRQLRVAEGGPALDWDFASIEWGIDAFESPPAAE